MCLACCKYNWSSILEIWWICYQFFVRVDKYSSDISNQFFSYEMTIHLNMVGPPWKIGLEPMYNAAWLSRTRSVWELSSNLSFLRSCFSHMSSQGTHVIILYCAFALYLAPTFYFSLFHYIKLPQQKHNCLKWSIYSLVILHSKC